MKFLGHDIEDIANIFVNDPYYELSYNIIINYLRSEQTDKMYCRKLRLRDVIFRPIRQLFPKSGLYTLGSTITGFGLHNSDLDLCMVTQKNTRYTELTLLKFLQIFLLFYYPTSFAKISYVNANVKLLKFTDQLSGITCDLNINNDESIRNTFLLHCYNLYDTRLAPLVLFVKKWANKKQINDAYRGTLSSYSLVLMVVFFLQCGTDPPIFPSLQRKYPHRFSGHFSSMSTGKIEPERQSANVEKLSELFLGFLNFYSYQFNFHSQVVSVRLGKKMSLFEYGQMKTCFSHSYIYIEEPFTGRNTAHAVYDKRNFRRILETFRSSLKASRRYGRLCRQTRCKDTHVAEETLM